MQPHIDLYQVTKDNVCTHIQFYKCCPYVVFTDKKGEVYEGLIMALSSKEVVINKLGYTDKNGNLLEKIRTLDDAKKSGDTNMGWIQINKVYFEDQVKVFAMKP